MSRLRQEEESRAYSRMTGSSSLKESFAQRFPNSQHAHLFPTTKDDVGDENEVSYADINRQMAVIINVLVSIIACAVALWIAARHWSAPSRLGLSMGGSGVIGAAEVVVYAGYLRRVKEAKTRSEQEVEVKEIIDTWVIDSKESSKDRKQPVAVPSSHTAETGLRKRSALTKANTTPEC